MSGKYSTYSSTHSWLCIYVNAARSGAVASRYSACVSPCNLKGLCEHDGDAIPSRLRPREVVNHVRRRERAFKFFGKL